VGKEIAPAFESDGERGGLWRLGEMRRREEGIVAARGPLSTFRSLSDGVLWNTHRLRGGGIRGEGRYGALFHLSENGRI